MKNYILRRMFTGFIVIIGVIIITFFLTRVIPSDPARKWAGPKATPEQVEKARIELGLDQPKIKQLGKYLLDLSKGNLGYSLRSKQPVAKELVKYLPATLELILLPTLIAVVIGIFLGIASANSKDHWIDHFSRFFSVGAISLPIFWVALFLQLFFYGIFKILPLGGQLSLEVGILHEVERITGFLLIDTLITGNFIAFQDALKHLVLPGITIALFPLGLVARMTRSALLEILNEDYIKASRSYGLSEMVVLCQYALKNSLGPTATVVANSIAATLVNTFLIEAIFNWPGIGMYISTAITTLDYPVIMGVTIVSACAYIIMNLVADIIIALDPRVRI